MITKKSMGCGELVYDATNFVLTVPREFKAEERATAIGAAVVLKYSFFERSGEK